MSRLQKKANLIGTIESLLDAVGEEEKVATDVGVSSHPSDKVDDGTQPATEGERSSENESDTESEPNRGLSVNEAGEGSSISQENIQSDLSLDAASTGEDSSIETSSAKSDKDDPGSAHPARADNSAIAAEKYASPAAALRALTKKAEEIGSEICSMIAVDYPGVRLSEQGSPGGGNPREKRSAGTEGETVEAAQAGYDLAGVFDGVEMSSDDKQAADAMVVDTIGNVLGLAARRADKCAEFYSEHFKAAYHNGEELPPEEEQHHEHEHEQGIEEMLGGGGGGLEDAVSDAVVAETSEDIEDGMGGGGAPIDEAALLDLLSGGEEMGAEEAVGDMAGVDDLAGLVGAEGLGGVEGLGDAAGVGDMSGEDDLAMLEAVLNELGVSPDELEVAAAQKIAARKSKTEWEPKTASDQQKYAKMKEVIKELVSRSR